MLELFRKLVLAGGIMFVAPGSSGQIGFALIITLFFFAMHMMKKPYKHVLHDIVKGLSELVIFVVLLSCLMCKPALNIIQTSDMVTDRDGGIHHRHRGGHRHYDCFRSPKAHPGAPGRDQRAGHWATDGERYGSDDGEPDRERYGMMVNPMVNPMVEETMVDEEIDRIASKKF